MEEKIRTVIVKPGEPAVAVDIDKGLESLQEQVDGLIQCMYPYDDNTGLICNDDGKLLGMPLNRALRDENGEIYDVVAGPFLVAGLSEEDFQSLTPEQENRYLDMYKTPERFERRNGRIVAIPIEPVMSFSDFRAEVLKKLEHDLREDYPGISVEPISVDQSLKKYEGVCVKLPGESIGVSINLAEPYDVYRHTSDLKSIVNSIKDAVREGLSQRSILPVNRISDYKWAREHVSVEVVNADRHMSHLDDVPHDIIGDLAVIYRIHLSNDATAVVTNSMLQQWGFSEENFKKDVLKASEKNFPVQIQPLYEALSNMTAQEVPESYVPVYVCTADRLESGGAGVIAYESLGEKAAEMLGDNFYILPSSRHELLLIPEVAGNPVELEAMVQSINASPVIGESDFLSDHLYHYDVITRKIELASEYQARVQSLSERMVVVGRKRVR